MKISYIHTWHRYVKQSLFSFLVLVFPLLMNSGLKAQAWTGNLGGGMDDWVYSTVIYNGKLIAGGKFLNAGGQPASHIAQWDGTTWQPLGLGVNGKVNALCVFNGNLIVGGEFTMAGGQPMNFIATWNGTAWSNDLGDMASIVTSLIVFQNELIAGGYFVDADGVPVNNIAKHTDIGWVALGGGTGGSQGQVMAMTIHNNELYAGGFFTSAGGVPCNHIARWDGTAWHNLGTGISNIVYALGSYNGDLIAGGLFLSAGGVAANHVARWDGSAWHAMGTGMGGTWYQYVFALVPYHGKLIAAGYFTYSDGQTTNGIAQWDGTHWSPMGTGFFYPANVMGAHTAIQVGNDLVVGGLFQSAGSIGAGHIALWSEPGPTGSLTLQTTTQPSCQGLATGSAGVQVSGGTAPYTYHWNTGAATQTLNNVAAGTYPVTVTDFMGLTATTTATVTSVSPTALPAPASVAYSNPVCPGALGQSFRVSPVANAASYLWTTSAGTIVSGSTDTVMTMDFPPSFSTLTISVKAVNSCGVAGTARSVTLTAPLVATPGIPSGETLVCPGSTGKVYSVAAVSGAVSYQWVLSAGTIVSGQGTNAVTVNFPASYSSLTVKVQGINSCGVASALKSLTVKAPVAKAPGAISGPINEVCGGSVAQYSIVPVAGATAYVWTVGTATLVTGQGTNAIALQMPPSYSSMAITVKTQNQCGKLSTAKSVTVRSVPVAPTAVTVSGVVCAGNSVSFAVSPVAGARNYQWILPAAGWAEVSGQGTATYNTTAGTTAGAIQVAATNLCGSSTYYRKTLTAGTCKMDQPENEYNFQVYPNPFADELRVKLSDASEVLSVDLINIQGEKFNPSYTVDDQTLVLPTGELASGAWFIEVRTTQGVYHRQVLKP